MAESTSITGKTFLFVDDRPATMTYFIETLKKLKNTVLVKRTINEAANLVDRSIDFVVIDLFLDPPDGRFDKYKEIVQQTGTNQGQLLGLYLRERGVPYLYLSASPSWFQKNAPEQDVKALKKASESWSGFIEQLTTQLGAPPAGEERA